jgi:hypothetical protein
LKINKLSDTSKALQSSISLEGATTEDVTNYGCIDMTVLFNGNVYIFEFKVNKTKSGINGKTLQQIKDRNYADKYQARNEPIHLIGVEFSKNNRNIVGFEVETV